MANLKEQAQWEDGIYQYEITDPLQGGEDGIDNVQGKQLANRTLYLKEALEQHQAADNPHNVTASQTGAYSKQETDAKIEDSCNWALVDESKARNLLDVLGVRAVHSDEPATFEEIKKVMEILHKKINPDGIPDFSGLRLCDYLDLPEINDGTTTYKWNGKYKNLRIMIAAFNLYQKRKQQKNHIVFTFRNCVLVRNVGIVGKFTCYGDSPLATYLNGAFKSGIEAVIGNYLYNVDRLDIVIPSLKWQEYTIFLPTELEVWGNALFCLSHIENEFQAQYPIYRDSFLYKAKQYNGLICSWWQGSMCTIEGIQNSFCMCDGWSEEYYKCDVGLGVAPAFCIS